MLFNLKITVNNAVSGKWGDRKSGFFNHIRNTWKQKTGTHLFKNDLRLHDNQAMVTAQQACSEVLSCYCLEKSDFENYYLAFPKADLNRFRFLEQSAANLKAKLKSIGCQLLVDSFSDIINSEIRLIQVRIISWWPSNPKKGAALRLMKIEYMNNITLIAGQPASMVRPFQQSKYRHQKPTTRGCRPVWLGKLKAGVPKHPACSTTLHRLRSNNLAALVVLNQEWGNKFL